MDKPPSYKITAVERAKIVGEYDRAVTYSSENSCVLDYVWSELLKYGIQLTYNQSEFCAFMLEQDDLLPTIHIIEKIQVGNGSRIYSTETRLMFRKHKVISYHRQLDPIHNNYRYK